MCTVRAFVLTAVALPLVAAPGRVTMSLDGVWDIDESVAATEAPTTYRHRVQVPGLANLAKPGFADVDQFDSRELIDNKIRKNLLPASARTTAAGVSRQTRNYFWYRTSFRPTTKKTAAILRVNKAQFTTAVWLNGKPAGEHAGCFTAGIFDLTSLIRWDGQNELVVRVGAHPGIVPASVPAGTDFEKLKWTPGIYDSVSLELSDNPVIESIQVAPKLATSQALIQTELRNLASTAVSFTLQHQVKAWKEGTPAGAARPEKLTLKPGERRTVKQYVTLTNPKLWTPENPFLYVVESSTGGDSATTRFGMREIRFDTATRRAFLNGKPYFLRGSNITLHRFFEDPKAGALTWDEKWVRKLLVDIPKKMHWNSFRFCIGPVPQRWLDIADEAGLLIQYEYFIWTGRSAWHKEWGETELVREYTEWLRDNWNHPSVAIWDACNETIADILGDRVIPAVRGLDLSDRAWENGYNLPAGPNDPFEDHPYLFSGIVPTRDRPFRVTDLEGYPIRQANSAHPTGHAAINNEYGWLWLNRDGTPTLLTKEVWDTLAPQATNAERLKHWAYYLGGLTEYWRSTRNFAAVMHFVYLTCSFPGVFTSDHWRDVEKLEIDPDFADYAGEAFKPLGVYLNFWQPSLKAGSERRIDVSVTNDEPEAAKGKLTLTIQGADGRELLTEAKAIEVPGLGQQTYRFTLTVPKVGGACLIRAAAQAGSGTTISRRRTKIVE